MLDVPVVCELLYARRAEILEQWLAAIASMRAARGLTPEAIVDSLPAFFEALCRGAPDRAQDLLDEHFSARIRQGFALDDLLAEQQLLGRAIAASHRGPALEPPEIEREMEELLGAVRGASERLAGLFVEQMSEDEQEEKLLARRLERLVDHAAPSEALAPMLERLLGIVTDGWTVEVAAILLFDRHGHRLVSATWGGAAAGRLEQFARDAMSHALACPGALEREISVRIDDLPMRATEPGDALHTSGLRSLLGVCLPVREALAGVLYVGAREERRFTPREVHRLESVCDRIAVHLENRVLRTELADVSSALGVERTVRDRFVSMISHDLRTPLSVVKMRAALLARAPVLDESVARDAGRRIVRAVDETDALIRDLVDAVRARAGTRPPLERTDCSLDEIARDVADEQSAASPRAQIVVEGARDVRGSFDRRELYRAIASLVSTAVRHGEPGRPVTIRIARDRRVARVAVQLPGVPIQPIAQRAIFDPFTQSRDEGGLGVGPALARAIAEAHGGTARVEGDAEVGTVFTLELPIRAAAAAHPPPTP